jgi:hypothetical protein
MSDDARENKALPLALESLEEKINRWTGWDEGEWQMDWMKVYRSAVGWAAGGSLVGAAHALVSGRAVIPNALLFSGYTAMVTGIYFSSREVIFGREIERFRQESLALGLPETVARDYPWRWDILCGGLTGAITGALAGQRRNTALAGAILFGSAAVAIRASSAAISDFALPKMLPVEQIELERRRRRQVMTASELDRLEEREKIENESKKPWIFEKLPDWSPIQYETKLDRARKEEDKEYEEWMEREVEALRVSVGIKRELKALEESNSRVSNPTQSPRPHGLNDNSGAPTNLSSKSSSL